MTTKEAIRKRVWQLMTDMEILQGLCESAKVDTPAGHEDFYDGCMKVTKQYNGETG